MTEILADDSPLQEFLTYRLARLQSKLNMQASRILRRNAGITLTHWRILMQVGNLGRTTAAALSRNSSMDKGLISRNLKFLLGQDLVRSTPDRRDTRLHHLELTDAGKDMYARLLPIMEQRQMSLQSQLDREEMEHLISAIAKLERAADEDIEGTNAA